MKLPSQLTPRPSGSSNQIAYNEKDIRLNLIDIVKIIKKTRRGRSEFSHKLSMIDVYIEHLPEPDALLYMLDSLCEMARENLQFFVEKIGEDKVEYIYKCYILLHGENAFDASEERHRKYIEELHRQNQSHLAGYADQNLVPNKLKKEEDRLSDPIEQLIQRVKDRPDLAVACLKFLDEAVTRPEYAKLSAELTEARLEKIRERERQSKARYRQRLRAAAKSKPAVGP